MKVYLHDVNRGLGVFLLAVSFCCLGVAAVVAGVRRCPSRWMPLRR